MQLTCNKPASRKEKREQNKTCYEEYPQLSSSHQLQRQHEILISDNVCLELSNLHQWLLQSFFHFNSNQQKESKKKKKRKKDFQINQIKEQNSK